MSYIDKSDISKRTLIQLCDDDQDGVADAAVVTSIIEDAEGEVDSWLEGQYTTPVAVIDRLVSIHSFCANARGCQPTISPCLGTAADSNAGFLRGSRIAATPPSSGR